MTDLRDPSRIREIELRPVKSLGELAPLELRADEAPLIVRRKYGLFLATFVIPVIGAAIYLFLIASDRYVAEAQYVVRSTAAGGGAEASVLMESRGMSRARDETYVVGEYIASRDALTWLMERESLRDVFNHPQADFINRFPNFYTRDTIENNFKYYKRMVSTYIDGGTGIGTISVVAFAPEDAQRVANGLLRSAEDLINRMNDRAQKDAVVYARVALDDAKRRVQDVEVRLAEYRTQVGMIDPSDETAAAFATITTLSTEIAQLEAGIRQRESLTPNSPATAGVREKAASLRAELERRRQELTSEKGSVASKMAAYEQLALERTIASKALSAAEAGLIQARKSAEQQHLYLQTVVGPNRADQPTYPRRWLYLGAAILACGVLYSTLRALRQFAVEHAI